MIRAFDETSGNLPPGIHEATWEELVTRYGTTPRRLYLLAGLKQALDALNVAGWSTSFLDFFQRDRHSGEPKGIIAIDLGGLA